MGYKSKLRKVPFGKDIRNLISGEMEVEDRRAAMHRVEAYGEESMSFFLEALEEISQKIDIDCDDVYLMVLTMWYMAYKKEKRAFPLLMQLSLRKQHLEEMSYNLEESYPFALYHTFNGDYALLDKMMLTPGRESYAECTLIITAVDLCHNGIVDQELVKETLLKLLFSPYRKDEQIMEYLCMGLCIAPFPELMPLVKVMLEMGVASTYDVRGYEDCLSLLGNDNHFAAKDLFLTKALLPYPFYEELEYLQPESFE